MSAPKNQRPAHYTAAHERLEMATVTCLDADFAGTTNAIVEAFCRYCRDLKPEQFAAIQGHMGEINDEMSRALATWFKVCRKLGQAAIVQDHGPNG